MLRNLWTRRAREDARVERFLYAIELSSRYALNPDWTLQTVPDENPTEPMTGWRTDTVSIPRIILTASTL